MLLQSTSFYLQLSLFSFDRLHFALCHLVMKANVNSNLMGIFHDSDGGLYTSSGSQQPPPPPSSLVEVMALQIELIRQLVQGQEN